MNLWPQKLSNVNGSTPPAARTIVAAPRGLALPMDSTTYLHRYQLTPGENGAPVALHRGPGGVTFRAEDIETDQPVAVKLMPTYSFELAELQQLESEAHAAQQVNHPNIARLHDFGFVGGDIVFVTELLDGTTLDTWVNEHGPLPAAAVLRIAMQVVAGLTAAAFHSVVHRALQPANLMIVPGQTPDGEWPFVKVLNFGGVPPTLSNSAVSFGQGGPSPQFAAPEQLAGKPADFRSELYSLGCTMWFLLTGTMPTPGAVDKGGRIPKPLRPVLAQLVHPDPLQRPQDPVLLQEQLANCLARVEHRAPIVSKFATPVALPTAAASIATPADEMTPDAITAGQTTPQRALLKPLALAAAVLLFAGLVALALPYIRLSHSAEKTVGVPVGVPEASPAQSTQGSGEAIAANSASQSPVAETATQPDATAPEATAAVNAAAPAPALVSVPAPTPVDTAADEPAAEIAATPTQAPALAANSTTATEAAEPPPPAEGPSNNNRSQPPAPNSDVARSDASSSASDPIDDSASRATSKAVAARKPAVETPEEKTPRVTKAAPKRPSRIARNEARRAEPVTDDFASAPPIPRGAKRAKFLGTTPEGDLVFGLPSDQRGFVAPPPAYVPERRRARRAQPVTEPPVEERVLPAEPVAPDEAD